MFVLIHHALRRNRTVQRRAQNPRLRTFILTALPCRLLQQGGQYRGFVRRRVKHAPEVHFLPVEQLVDLQVELPVQVAE